MLPFTWVDVFAAGPLQGNQLCVVHAPSDLPVAAMQAITRELNHSETAFLQPAADSGADCRLRILIPTLPLAAEVPFAGHPVLGSACVAAGPDGGTVILETGVGPLSVSVSARGEGLWEAWMEQPPPRSVWADRVRRDALAAALGLDLAEIRTDLPVEAVDNGMQTVLVPLVSVAAVQRARPDLARLRELLGRDGLCTLVFGPGGVEAGSDWHCRVFSPFDLVPEDPATGSANGPLGGYLVRHGVATGAVLRIEQGYEIGRPSQLFVSVDHSGRLPRVAVGGQVRLAGRGEIRWLP